MSEGARSGEDLREEGFASEELSRGVKAEEGSDGEEDSDSGQLGAGDPGFISNGEGENHKDHREQEVPEHTEKHHVFI